MVWMILRFGHMCQDVLSFSCTRVAVGGVACVALSATLNYASPTVLQRANATFPHLRGRPVPVLDAFNGMPAPNRLTKVAHSDILVTQVRGFRAVQVVGDLGELGFARLGRRESEK
jgi:hypothetical protein